MNHGTSLGSLMKIKDKQYHIVFPKLGPHVGNTDGLTKE